MSKEKEVVGGERMTDLEALEKKINDIIQGLAIVIVLQGVTTATVIICSALQFL